MPQVNITIIVHGKLTGHSKRRYHDQVWVGRCGYLKYCLLQAINKLLPLFQKFSMKQQLDVIVVELKADVLCSFSAQVNVRKTALLHSALCDLGVVFFLEADVRK